MVGGEWLTVSRDDGQLRFVDPVDGVTIDSIDIVDPQGDFIDQGYSLAVAPDGGVWVVYQSNNTSGRAIGLLDVTTGEIGTSFDTGLSISEIAFDDIGNVFVIDGNGFGSFSDTLYVADPIAQTLTPVFEFSEGNNGAGAAIAFGDDGLLYHTSGPTNDFGVSGLTEGGDGPVAAANRDTGDFQSLQILSGNDSTDVYRVSLESDQWLTLTSTLGRGGLELLDDAGNVLAVGARRGGLMAIEGFIAPTAGDYFARGGGGGGSAWRDSRPITNW